MDEINAYEHEQRFNDTVTKISEESYPVLLRRVMQTEAEAFAEYAKVSEEKADKSKRTEDEKALAAVRTKTDNAHIGLHGMKYIIGAREQRAAREFFFNHAISKMKEPHGEIDKDLTVFLKDDETAHVSNVELLTAFASKDEEKIRPYLEKMMISVLSEDMSWGMLNDQWLADNAGELSEKIERFRVFDKLYDENKWFRYYLPDNMKSLIENRLKEASIFREALELKFERQGIDIDNNVIRKHFHYRDYKDIKSEAEIKKSLNAKREEFQKTLVRDFEITKFIRIVNDEEQSQSAEEVRRTEAPENAGYKEAKRLIKDVPEEMREDFDKALKDMTTDIGDFSFSNWNYLNYDTVTEELRAASHDYRYLRTKMKGRGAKTVSLEENVNALLRLSAAAHAFRHVNGASSWYGTSERQKRANTIASNVKIFIDRCLEGEDRKDALEPLEHFKLSSEKNKKAKVKAKVVETTYELKKLHRAWKKWRVVLSKDNLDTPERRLLRYKRLFDDYREPLQLWVSNKELFKEYGSKSENEFAERAIAEYTRVTHELAFIDWARKKGNPARIQKSEVDARIDEELKKADDIREMKPLKQAVDDGLDEEQKRHVLQADQWMLRNINELDQSELVTKLLRKTKRERLYIYYLIESNARVKPSAEDIEKSQKDYHPNVAKIKSRMVKSRFKLLARYNKTTIYWDKLRQAMDICDGNRCLIRELYEPKTGDAENEDELKPTEARKLRAFNTYRALDKYRTIVAQCGGDKDEVLKRKDELEAASAELKESYDSMLEAEMNDRADAGSLKQEALAEANGIEKMAAFMAVGKGLKFEKFGFAGAAVGGTALIADGAINLIMQITDLCMQWSDISGSELLSKIADIVSTATSTAGTVWQNVSNMMDVAGGVAKDVAKQTAAQIANVVSTASSSVNVTAGLAQMIIQTTQGAHAASAHEHLKRKYESGQANASEREKRYDKELLKFSDMVRKYKLEKATSYVAGGMLGLAALAFAPVGIYFSLASMALKPSINFLGNKGISEISQKLVDGFVELERMLPIIIAERRGWKRVEDTATGRILYRDSRNHFHEEREVMEAPEKEKIRKALQKKIAVKYNFGSYGAMLSMVAKRYAQFIHSKLFPVPGEDFEYYKQLLGSFGLTYKAASANKPGKPTVEMIAKKLMGK